MKETFQIHEENVLKAISYADKAQERFQEELETQGKRVLEDVTQKGTFAVVLAE